MRQQLPLLVSTLAELGRSAAAAAGGGARSLANGARRFAVLLLDDLAEGGRIEGLGIGRDLSVHFVSFVWLSLATIWLKKGVRECGSSSRCWYRHSPSSDVPQPQPQEAEPAPLRTVRAASPYFCWTTSRRAVGSRVWGSVGI